MKKIALVSLLIFILVFSIGCDPRATGFTVESQKYIVHIDNETIPLKVAELNNIDMKSFDTYDEFSLFAENFNGLIRIINEIDKVDMPLIPITDSSWKKAMDNINKYTPLIGSYNDVVTSAKLYQSEKSEDNLNDFYISTALFAFDATVIIFAVFHTITFNAVGTVYRASGLNTFAFKNPALVSFILKNSYRTVKITLVKESRKIALFILDSLVKINEGIDWNQINADAKQFISNTQEKIIAFNITSSLQKIGVVG